VNTIRSFLSQVPSTVLYIAAGVLLIGLHTSLEVGSQAQALVYDFVGCSAVAVALFGAWRNRPERRWPWILIAVGQASFVAGDLLWNRRQPRSPSDRGQAPSPPSSSTWTTSRPSTTPLAMAPATRPWWPWPTVCDPRCGGRTWLPVSAGTSSAFSFRDLPDESGAIEVAERLLTTLNEPLLIADVAVDAGASIGIATDSPSMRTVDDLLGDADIAMYRAKAQGKGRYHVFRETDPEARAARDQTWVERGPTVRRREPLRVAEPRRPEPRLEPAAG
jgi:hypothetical protein